MDSDGLPLVGTGIDFTKVGAIHQKRTLAFLNHFVSHTVRFLNRFSCVCEEKLEALTVRLHRLETTMNVLEAKLSSIPGLENVTAPTTDAVETTKSAEMQPSAAASGENEKSTDPVATQTSPPAEETPPGKPTLTVSQDPKYMRYFKMMQVGVPAPAVKTKMVADGFNPDYLDTPDAPAPEEDQADSDTDFSDDNQAEESSEDDSSGFSD